MAIFDIPKTVQFWLDPSAKDLETGRVLLNQKQFPDALIFARLALEKILKAIYVKATQENAPDTPSLPYLARSAGLEIPQSIMDQLAEYTQFHSPARPPDPTIGFFEECTEEFSRKKFGEMEHLYRWLMGELRSLF